MSELTKKTLIIENMHCASCASLIDLELEEINGVKTSVTNYAKSVCEVEFEENLVSLKQLVLKIGDIGYSVKTVE